MALKVTDDGSDTVFVSRCSLKEYRIKGRDDRMLVLYPLTGKRELVISPQEFEIFFYKKNA